VLTAGPAWSFYRGKSALNKEVRVDWSLVALILGEFAFVAFIIWLLVRRFQEKARLRMEMQAKLIERCSSAEELERFLASEGGRWLMNNLSPGRASSPAWAIVASVQVGVVLLVVGLGVLYGVGIDKIEKDYTMPGIVMLALGVGLLLASEFSERLSRRYGLLPNKKPKAAPSQE
jgi:hypothetical protein